MTLRELRKRRFLTIAELAEKLGVSSQTVWDWEMGVWKPSMKNLRKLHDLFGDDVFEAVK